MFGAPQQSPAEIRAMEEVASQTVYGTLATCAVLYLSPFVVNYVRKLV